MTLQDSPLTLSAVIPTRNRPDDLGKAVASVLSQTRPPDELIVIDQSPGSESEMLVRSMCSGTDRTRLIYVHDTGITGLVEAKRAATAVAAGDIVSFLEDDVILQADFMQEIEGGFLATPDMCGCSGVITNWPRSTGWYLAAHRVFFRGIFHDPRVGIFERALGGAEQLIPCDMLSGGLSAWRRHVFERVAFDTRNDLFMFEDIDFSTRVVRALGHCLYVNPKARLEHRWSEVNRDVHGTRQRRKLVEALTFYKKRRDWPGARRGLMMAMVWWLGDAILQAIRIRSSGPVRGYFRGVIDGMQKPLAT